MIVSKFVVHRRKNKHQHKQTLENLDIEAKGMTLEYSYGSSSKSQEGGNTITKTVNKPERPNQISE